MPFSEAPSCSTLSGVLPGSWDTLNVSTLHLGANKLRGVHLESPCRCFLALTQVESVSVTMLPACLSTAAL